MSSGAPLTKSPRFPSCSTKTDTRRRSKSNGASSIYLGGDGYWHGRVTVGVKNDGSEDRRHVKRTTERAVIAGVRELERARDEGRVRRPGRTW